MAAGQQQVFLLLLLECWPGWKAAQELVFNSNGRWSCWISDFLKERDFFLFSFLFFLEEGRVRSNSRSIYLLLKSPSIRPTQDVKVAASISWLERERGRVEFCPMENEKRTQHTFILFELHKELFFSAESVQQADQKWFVCLNWLNFNWSLVGRRRLVIITQRKLFYANNNSKSSIWPVENCI